MDFREYFRLKPTRAAKVSEISEATASSAVPPGERVNFHIGNPVQEKSLSAAYLRAALGLDIREESLADEDYDGLLHALGWREDERPIVELFAELIRRSAPYLPRGGFARTAPSPLVQAFSSWLNKQQEPLTYDLGTSSGRREIILSSGGTHEALRVFFHTLSVYLARIPARVLLFRAALPNHIVSFDRLRFECLPTDEASALPRTRSILEGEPAVPTFVVLGAPTSEQTRRSLLSLSARHPLFFLEINDAPNHRSLAREATLVDRVIRFLTPAILSPRFRDLSLVFIAGNAEYLSHLETIHFQLKGTPSASEVELLTYFLERAPSDGFDQERARALAVEAPIENVGFGLHAEGTAARRASLAERRLAAALAPAEERAGAVTAAIESRITRIASRLQPRGLLAVPDRFESKNAAELIHELGGLSDARDWIRDLSTSFLAAFTKHHPEYELSRCVVVSGSARTALSLLGFHCGIKEVAIPDLSWSYEHCFPSVLAVPLTASLELDADAMIAAVRDRIADDPKWAEYGAVVLNNPHNATGGVFEAERVRRLIRWLLERGITVIDDLAYQNVVPADDLPDIPTVRQLADDLVRSGYIDSARASCVVTVHSISKTDCLAGARLAVVEIRREDLFERFSALNETVKPNVGAILLAYLFYRNSLEVARGYWRLRNLILSERMCALTEALSSLPADRNPHGIRIRPPRGSMYPLMEIEGLPAGLSLEWIASGLARQGIGMIPLSTFARTEKGFEDARKSFRLTLGGADGAAVLPSKTRRLLIDLNRLLAEEGANYSRRRFTSARVLQLRGDSLNAWSSVERDVRESVLALAGGARLPMKGELRDERIARSLTGDFLRDRLAVFRQRFLDRSLIVQEITPAAAANGGRNLGRMLEREFYKDDLARREQAFRLRLFDRTVHPTQMWSIRTEAAFDAIIASMLRGGPPPQGLISEAARELVREFLGLNVAISSSDESDEIIIDLSAHISAELWGELQGAGLPRTFLSFWGDWDGSNRPSGQGHRLVASVLIENVNRLTRILQLLVQCDTTVRTSPDLLSEIERLPRNTRRFIDLLNQITALTHQLEARYRGILPFRATPRPLRRIGMALHLARDPVTSLWRHNDRLERHMLDLRRRRREALEYYFALNKRLRKELHRLIPDIQRNVHHRALLHEAALYRDLLQRFVVTPRINQLLITALDPFAIDTTVINIHEINEIGARFGNPGMVLGLQVSMATRPEALISLERKMRARREHVLRDHPGTDLPAVWLIPLFENADAVRGITDYLGKLWEYALQSRRLNQDTRERFGEVIGEIFIAGSDLSQQVGQPAGAFLYRQAKHGIMRWLAERGLAQQVRLKLGSGEPAFLTGGDSPRRFAAHLRESTRRSTVYAVTPMLGVFSGGDLRTLQSAISEKVRHLPAEKFAQLLYHMDAAQRTHQRDLARASEELAESRSPSSRHGEQALERLTLGAREPAFEDFLKVFTENFRQILYGREEDVVGLHIISYFIARTTPSLRDRPTVRPSHDGKDAGSRILERIAQTIPLSRYGSLLRAIAHNHAQTAVLGINQLTTGLFRALDAFSGGKSMEGDPETYLADRILPHLPVLEMLQSLRLYHDASLHQLNAMERAFPAGNSAFLALREDIDAMGRYIPLFQQELLRRHGIEVSDFFDGGRFIPALLPTLRPDLAVLLQPDIFNTNLERLRESIGGSLERSWLEAMRGLLSAREEIGRWRVSAWSLLERPVFQRVQSFVELAVSLSTIASRSLSTELLPPGRGPKLSSSLAHFFRMTQAGDEMREFLAAAIEYLTVASEGMVEVPANIIRAMKEIERIAAIEEQALTADQQDRLRFYLLQISRVAGESG
ncbi:MAG: aminotransferase class I/II-fold pyridoxal phosphate-dependent enzyme [Acidobacteria bacterium]|nr:aminotransferase class I/II-fold pyridoxal phosphate-dependent enzyme [Acidobacteriota bacterium]